MIVGVVSNNFIGTNHDAKQIVTPLSLWSMKPQSNIFLEKGVKFSFVSFRAKITQKRDSHF